jgi:hypothetical protein
LKLAIAEGRTYHVETRNRTLWLWSDSELGIVLRGRPGQVQRDHD